MATGKKALDIFQQTAKKKGKDIAVEVPERIKGRPAVEPYQKVTVVLFDRQIIALDRVALAIRERTGQAVSRAELIRTVLDDVALDTEAKDFDAVVRRLFP